MGAHLADFSFQQDSLLSSTDEPGSPKPIPQSSTFFFGRDNSDTAATLSDLDSAISGNFSKIVKISDSTTSSNMGTDARNDTLLTSSTISSNMPPPKTPKRVKIPLEKGYSQMDWLKLTQVRDDLAGIKGWSNRRPISMEELKQHKAENDAWTVLRGRVYNISPYLRFHPGGIDMLMKGAGKDCTALFNKYHPWVNAEFMLEKCQVGLLDVSSAK
ncbi:hypothetical protein O6H91_08G069800 [Diphasiastrum complanatum]|uniref:Uncharacterized protein n=1 Tax=Diphasiastrum complanatum TaxID=34168 RepID=A0ACC2CYS9_DIPCM|nr:hypothetical protein O6H91_08G069800 [Diphasiastrum complanatum]